MSPEQAGLGGLDMDTRSDIYALGVLLYELLTGRTPFESKELLRLSLDEMRRTIREREPARPSTRLRTLSEADLATLAERRQTEAPQLIHLVRGDLDWIVMRCLEKDRNRRYATANGLAADIQRHVNHEPVVARPPSKLYRLRKLARRNLVAFTAVNAVAATLAIGLGVSLWLLRRERQAHREAHEAEARATVHLSDSFLAEARAHRFSGRAGRRFEGLDAVVRAVALTPGAEDRFRLELRNQAIALLALSDVRIGRRLQTPSGEAAPCAVDSAYRLYAYSDRSGNVTLRRFADDRAVTILPGFGFHAALLQFNLDGKYLAVQYDNAQRAGNKVIQIWELPESHTGRATGSSEQERGLQAASALVTDEASDAPPSSGVSAVLRPGNARNSQAHSRVVLALTNVLPRTSGVAFDFHPVLPRVAIPDGEQTIALYDLPSGQRSGRVTTKVPPYAFAFSPDGQWLAVSGYGRTNVFVLALPDGSLAHTLSHPRGVLSLAWHPSEQVLATGTAGGHVHLWDVTEGLQHTLSHGHRDQVVRFAFSRDGNLLASGGWDNKVCLWDPVTEELLCRISARAAPLIFDLAGQWLGLAPEAETLRVLEVAPNYVCRTLRLHAATNIVPLGAFSNDGRVLAVATEHGTALWDLTRRIEARRLGSQQVRAVQFTPDGKNLLVGGNSLQRWPIRVEEGRPAHLRLGPVQPLITSQDVPGLCLIPGTRKVAFVSGVSQSGGILDLDAPSRRIPLRGAMAASTVSASPDGQWLATGTWHSQDVVIWDAASGATITNLPVGTSATALFSPDGQWLVTTSKGQITQWETRSWRARHRYAAEPGAGLMAFSPDARLLAIRKSDAEVLLLSPERGQEVATLPGELPLPLCFSPDGALLAVVEDERRVRLWDLRRLRAELTKLTLDWDLPPYPAVKIAASVPPLRVEVVTE